MNWISSRSKTWSQCDSQKLRDINTNWMPISILPVCVWLVGHFGNWTKRNVSKVQRLYKWEKEKQSFATEQKAHSMNFKLVCKSFLNEKEKKIIPIIKHTHRVLMNHVSRFFFLVVLSSNFNGKSSRKLYASVVIHSPRSHYCFFICISLFGEPDGFLANYVHKYYFD